MPRTWYCCNKFTRSWRTQVVGPWASLRARWWSHPGMCLEAPFQLSSFLFWGKQGCFWEVYWSKVSRPSPVKVYWSKLSTITHHCTGFQKILVTCNSSSAPYSSPSYQDAALEHPAHLPVLRPEQEIYELRGYEELELLVSMLSGCQMISAEKSKPKTSIVGPLKRVTSWTCKDHYLDTLQTAGNSAKWCSEAKIIHLLMLKILQNSNIGKQTNTNHHKSSNI